MEESKPFTGDVDAQLAESAKLLQEMEVLMRRMRVLILDHQRVVAVSREQPGEKPKGE